MIRVQIKGKRNDVRDARERLWEFADIATTSSFVEDDNGDVTMIARFPNKLDKTVRLTCNNHNVTITKRQLT